MDETYSVMDVWLNKFHGVHRVDMKDKEALRNMRKAYYALVSYVDKKVGQLINALEETGLKHNTVIIFVSDHGDMLGEKGMVQKRTFYENSCRIPMIIGYPDGWKGGTQIKQHVSLLDLAPTIMDLAGVPAEKRFPMDGKSLLPLLDGTHTEDRVVFSQMHTEGVFGNCFMVREGRYKYVYIHNEGAQLFDLENDPKEWNNLSGCTEYREVEDKLNQLILSKFDPERIEREIRKSLRKRRIIREAMKITKTKWDYYPYFDASKQYWKDEQGRQ